MEKEENIQVTRYTAGLKSPDAQVRGARDRRQLDEGGPACVLHGGIAGLLFFSRDTDKPGLYQRTVASFMAGRLWYLNIISAKRLLEQFRKGEVVKRQA